MEEFVKEYQQLTESEKRVFSYIYKHQKEVAYMKSQELARETMSSKTVIINTCKKLEFEGLGDLKYYLKTHRKIMEGEREISAVFDTLPYQIIDRIKKR